MSVAAGERLSIEGPAGALECVVEDVARPGSRYAVICHPHPVFGGTMDNKVVTTLARALQSAGIPVIRFNFRGVGASGGRFDQGVGETADAEAVAQWGAERWPGRELVLTGFSFGAYVALRLAQQPRLAYLISIAPPVDRFDVAGLRVPSCPWLIVQGDSDDVVNPAAVIDWARGLHPQPQLAVLPGVGHFFHGRLHDLRDAVIQAIQSG
jgi:uncharacterized protein